MITYHENQVPWPPDRAVTESRKNGPFRTNLSDACERVEGAVSAFTSRGRQWRTNELWIYVDGDLGAKGRFIANQRGIRDPRVAVEFDLDGLKYRIVADRYVEPWQNLAGIAEYIKAIRAQERNGIFTASEMFASFTALPARAHWSSVLGLNLPVTRGEIETAYRRLAKQRHPDVGGSDDEMAELNAAYEQAKEEVAR